MKSYLFLALLFTIGGASAQKNYYQQIEQSKKVIDSIVKTEKKALSIELKTLDEQFADKKISEEQLQTLKKEATNQSKIRIADKTKEETDKLSELVRQQLLSHDTEPTPPTSSHEPCIIKRIDSWLSATSDSLSKPQRTTSYPVYSLGFHNLKQGNHFSNNYFRTNYSNSLEIGFLMNTRLLKNNNLLHLTYGTSLLVNTLRMKGNTYYVIDDNITKIMPYPKEVTLSKFKTHYMIVPLNLEFDFTKPVEKKGKTYYPFAESFRFGVGGYIGVLWTAKQKIKYNEQGGKVKDVAFKNFNVNELIYGVSAHIGYKSCLLYARYNLVPLFKSNPINEYPYSIGIRFEVF